MGMIKSKLKRRLRKKKHLGEFQQLGFEISVSLKKDFNEFEFGKFTDDFIVKIERSRLQFSGGGDGNAWAGFVTSEGKFTSPTDDDRKKIRIWLESRSEVEDCKVGELLDAWNEPKWND
jgi:uncharacterized protein YggL (DUF469 family)